MFNWKQDVKYMKKVAESDALERHLSSCFQAAKRYRYLFC